jgi:hypothetical protein
MLFMSVELVNKVGVDRQIADERMAIGEGKDFLFTLLANQTPNIFKAIRACCERLGTGGVDSASRVAIDETAQAHNGTQRFGSSSIKGALGPESALFAHDRGSADPITAGFNNRGVQTPGTQDMAKLT